MMLTDMLSKATRHLSIMVLCNLVSASALAEALYYRYVNEEGVKVLNHSIPPAYVQKGYEVVTASGEVIKTVKPAVSGEDVEKLEKERLAKETLEQWDKSLHRRYSAVDEIEAAKSRKLQQLDANVSLLWANINGLRDEVETQQLRAANIERAGRVIPEAVLVNIRNLKIELEHTEAQVVQRQKEYNDMAVKYDRDIERFKEIMANKQQRLGQKLQNTQ